ncbi:MAG: hypothetical protein KW793_02770 [Candidatus Doudnabacteria bacterium]|nr:hypothetical protein [Candidatus Doudnabacteria bacterium]
MKRIVLLAIGISLLAVQCNKIEVTPNPAPNLTQSTVFENQFLKLNISSGWTVREVGSNPAAVNISKGNYILYINTRATQASGAEGGRFAEIALGSTSADAVVTVQPSAPCGTSEKNSLFDIYSRVDLYVSSKDKSDYCTTPNNDSTVWYFSYITDGSGYFIHDWDSNPSNLVITMSFSSTNVDSYPVKGETELTKVFIEQTEMLQSLVIK